MADISLTHQIVERKRRGVALLAADAVNIAQVSWSMYLVRGSEGNDYKVVFADKPSCECQDFARNGAILCTCKHIESVRTFNRIYQLIERYGDDLLAMQAIVRAGVGSTRSRSLWEAVLSVLRHRAGIRVPADVLSFPIARAVAVQAVAA